MFFSLWKIEVPKDRVQALVEAMDADQDGYISLGEIRDMLKQYARHVKQSFRFDRKADKKADKRRR